MCRQWHQGNSAFVSCEWEGSASDAGVLRSAISKGFSVPEGKFYLVDGGYANTPSYIAPYRGVRYHLSQFRRSRSSQSGYANYKELFNHRHAILRNHIERAIGVLKKRFPILKVGTFHPIENQIKITAAAIAFHNIIRGQNGDEGWLDNQLDYISPSQYVDVPGGDNNYPNDTESSDGRKLDIAKTPHLQCLIVFKHKLINYCRQPTSVVRSDLLVYFHHLTLCHWDNCCNVIAAIVML